MKYAVTHDSLGNKILSATLAFGMHIGLLAFLMLGVQWATTEIPAGDPMSVDLWGDSDLGGAPLPFSNEQGEMPLQTKPNPQEPIDVPPLEQSPETAEVPEPSIPAEPETQAHQMANADIALKQAEQEAAEKRQQELARQEAARKKAEKEAAEKERREKEKREKQEKQKEQAEKEARARREAALKESLKRERANLQAAAGGVSNNGITGKGGSGSGTGSGRGRAGSGGTGSSVGLMREQAAYIAKIRAIVTPNIRYDPSFAESVQGSPEVTFEVSLLPDGTIGRVTLKNSSGDEEYNRIIKSAIDKTGRLPLPDKPEILPERRLNLYFRYP